MNKLKDWTVALGSLVMVMMAGTASAGLIVEIEPNDSMPTAQNIDSFFDVFFDINIENSAGANTSTTIPHATVLGSGDGTFDWYSFTVGIGDTVILDIDCGSFSHPTCSAPGFIDAWIDVFDPGGALFLSNDDSFLAVDTGSFAGGTLDSFAEFGAPVGGLWTVRVGEFCCPIPVLTGGGYLLNVSVANHAVPEPTTLALMGLGLAGIGYRRRKAA